MTTWNAADPAPLPPLRPSEYLAGALRLLAFLCLTLIALALFVAGRFLRGRVWHRVTFHFGVARLWSRATLWLTGLRLLVRGRPVHSGALVANHSTWADIPVLRSVTLLYFVAKSEVRGWPGVGFITQVTGTVFIERRRSQAKHQEQVLRERIAANQLLCFFPEGTSTDGLRVLPFKTSLFSAFFHDHHAADLWIQPVSIRYAPAPGSGLPASFYGWWGDMDFGSHIWQVMCRSFGGTAEVTFHDPVRPADFEDRKALARHCGQAAAAGHSAMAGQLNND